MCTLAQPCISNKYSPGQAVWVLVLVIVEGQSPLLAAFHPQHAVRNDLVASVVGVLFSKTDCTTVQKIRSMPELLHHGISVSIV